MKKGQESRTIELCKTLEAMVDNTRDVYLNSNEDNKAFMQTVIGAALWYLPNQSDSFSGYISKELLLQYFINGTKETSKSEEHIFPRKISAKELFEILDLSDGYVLSLYKERYCKLSYITPEENKKAIQFQKVGRFSNPKNTYLSAGIKLVHISNEEWNMVKRNNKQVIEELLKRDESYPEFEMQVA